MTIKKMWLFTITGKDETEIHGKLYRVEIKKIASKSKIRGSVRNIKFNPEIEVKLAIEEKDAALGFKKSLEQTLNEPKEDEEKFAFSDLRSFEDDDEKYRDFAVLREDELTEMVWALQGAGGVFLKSSQEILEVMIIRDLKKERGLLGALKLEVGFTKRAIEEMIEDIKEKKEVEFRFEQPCLQKAFVEPPWADNDSFLQLTSDLFYKMNRRNKPQFRTLDGEEQQNELYSLIAVAAEYYQMIDTRIQELDKQINKNIRAE